MLSSFVREASTLRGVLFACLCAMAVVLTTGCERPIAPPLVEVTDLAPREIEPGDRLEVHGSGFPQGRAGRVTLEGTVFRPGEPPVRGVSLDLAGAVVTPDRLEVVVDDVAAERLCGRGDRAAHATFRGDVEVAFASTIAGAPPLVGVLGGAVIDVTPSTTRARVFEARVAEGGRVLAFLGVVFGSPSPRGLPIEQVLPGSLAEGSGIRAGDVLVSVDGVNVLSLGDVAPASARSVDLEVRRGDSDIEETMTLSLIGYSGRRVPTEVAPALVIVGLALAVLVLMALPGPRPLAALERRIASQLRATKRRELFFALFGRGRAAALSALGSAVIAAFALTPYVVGREVDGIVLVAAATTTLVWSRVTAERGALASLRALARAALAALAMIGAIVVAIGQLGAIELAEIVRAQGGAPWQWGAAKHPSCALAAAVYAAAIVGLLRDRDRDRDRDRSYDARDEERVTLVERGGVLLASALAVTTFFGGWQLPGLSEPRSRGLLLLAALVLVVKTWLVTALFLGARRVLASKRPRDLPSLAAKRLAPGLVAAGALVVASRRVTPGFAIETAIGATLVAVAALFVLRMIARVRAALVRPEPHASPFL